MDFKGFIGASYRSIAQEVDVEDCVNLYPEIASSPNAKAGMVLYGSPGTSEYHYFGDTGPIRGSIEIEGYLYVVSGPILHRQDPDGTWHVCNTGTITDGAVGDDGKPVQIVASATNLLIVSNGVAFRASDLDLEPIVDPPWVLAQDCQYLNGFYIVLEDDNNPALQGGNFFISDDAITWDPLDFSNAPASNNTLLALAVDHGELWIYGTVVTQVFFYNPNAEFPFVPNPSGILQQGIESRDTRQQVDNTLIWVGRNKDGTLECFAADGYTPASITPPEIAQQWQRYTDATDAVAWTFQIDGHAFYHVNFISAGKSWRYDRSTKMWHRVMWRNPATNVEECHRGNNHIVRFGQHIIGDRENPRLWVMSPTLYADGANQLLAYRVAPSPFAGNKGVFYSLFELITPGGIGDGSEGTAESDPTWMLSWSSDSGHNFGNEFGLAAGPVGEYGKRLRKNGCGWGRNRVWKVAISAAVPRCLIGGQIEQKVGKS